MESRQSNKESAIQRGGNENVSSFVIVVVFSSFSLLISGKEFQVKASIGSQALLLFLLFFFLSVAPFWVAKTVYLLAQCF